MNPDGALFHLINNFVGTVPLMDWLARLLVNDYLVPTTMALAGIGLWFAGATPEERTRNQRAVIVIALAVVFANALIKDLHQIHFRPRPFAVEEVKLLFYRPSVSSFPSVPVAFAFCIVAGAWMANPRLGKMLALLGALFALSRVYTGVHYPSDVIAGAALGSGMVWVVRRLDFIVTPLADAVMAVARRLNYA